METKKNRQSKVSPLTATAIISLAAAVILLVLSFYYYADPGSRFMPRCTFKLLTGYDCPGCGFQRALHALLHGNISEAWQFNAFAFFAVPIALFYIVIESFSQRFSRIHSAATQPVILILILLAIIVFWVARNL